MKSTPSSILYATLIFYFVGSALVEALPRGGYLDGGASNEGYGASSRIAPDIGAEIGGYEDGKKSGEEKPSEGRKGMEEDPYRTENKPFDLCNGTEPDGGLDWSQGGVPRPNTLVVQGPRKKSTTSASGSTGAAKKNKGGEPSRLGLKRREAGQNNVSVGETIPSSG